MLRRAFAFAALVSSLALVATAHADAPPRPLKKPATAWAIGGASLSTIDDDKVASSLAAALAGRGYKVGSVLSSTACVWEARFVELSKGEANFEVYFKRPWAQPDEACDPKEARGPGDDAVDKATTTSSYDKKAEVILWVAPKLGRFGKQETPAQRAAMIAEAKALFGVVFKR